VNEVLSEFFHFAFEQPPYYAPYNGAIEESQGELKRCLRDKLGGPDFVPVNKSSRMREGCRTRFESPSPGLPGRRTSVSGVLSTLETNPLYEAREEGYL